MHLRSVHPTAQLYQSDLPRRETEHRTQTAKLARRSPIIQSINLYKETRAPFVWNIRRIWKRTGKMDLNRELGAQRAAPPGNKNRDLKERASPSLHLSPPPQGGEWCGLLPESQLGHGQLPGNSLNSFLSAFSHILRTSKVSIFIRDTVLKLIRITGRAVRHRQPRWPGEWNTEGKTLRGSDSSSTVAKCFLCSPEPMISTRLFSYPQNEDITTYLTGQKKKISEEGISIAHGHLACQGQLWVAMTHSPTKFAKPPPEEHPESQALTRHLENVSFLPRHLCCTWEWLQRAIFSPRPWTRACILLCLHKWVSDDHIFLRLCLPSQEQSELRRGMKNPNDDLIPTTSYIPNWVMRWAHWQTSLKQRSLTVKIFFLFKIKNSNSTVLSYNS